MLDRIRIFGYRAAAKLEHWDNLFLGVSALLWRNRKNIVSTLITAEILAHAVGKADRTDLEDIHSLDPAVFHGMAAVCFAITGTNPQEAIEKARSDAADVR